MRNLIQRDRVEAGGNFVDGSHAAFEEEALDETRGPTFGQVAQGEEVAFEHGFGACEFVGCDVFAYPHEFGLADIERFLGAIRCGACINGHETAAAIGLIEGRYAVRQAAFFPDFRK